MNTLRKHLLHGVLTLCICLVSGLTALGQTPEQEANQLKIMTYNVRHGEGLDGVTDYARTGKVIRDCGARFVAVQEVDSATGRSGGHDVLRELAIESGLYPTFARAIAYDGGAYGVGILSAEKPLGVRRVALPGREEGRVLLVAEFSRFVLACTHLSLTDADRLASIPIIKAEAERSAKPFVLAGDWNSLSESDFLKAISRDFTVVSTVKKSTFPADAPTECLDYIALYAAAEQPAIVRGSYVADAPVASDHRPVVATLQFKQPADEVFYAHPYLQNPTPDAITVMAQTHVRAHCWVEYGTDKQHLQRTRTLLGGQAVCHDVEHKIRLTDLTPGATYYYRVCAQEIIHYGAYSKTFGDTVRSEFYSFKLPAADTQDFTALIFNDLHDFGNTIKAMQQIAANIPHDFLVFNGDCLAEPENRSHAIRVIHTLANDFNGFQRPIFFIRGNHEIRNAYSAGMPSLLDNPGGKTYGAFNWGDTRFVLLDCGEDKPDSHWVYYGLNDFTQFRQEQAAFLQQELKSRAFKRAKRRVLIHHIPIWGNTDEYQPCSELWQPILEQAKFDIDLAAHVHAFKYYPTREIGNPFPVYVGGGPNLGEATVCVLAKKGKSLTLQVLNAKGEEIHKVEL